MLVCKLSRFLRVIEQNAFIAVFHQLHPEPVYFRKDLWENMAYGSEEFPKLTQDELVERKLLIEDDAVDCHELEAYRASISNSLDRPSILYLMLAQGCNNACTYCPIPAISLLRGYTLLSFDNAIAGIELWQRHLADWSDNDPYYVLFYGGEPLLNRTVFEQLVCDVAQRKMSGELPVNVELVLPTNGLLIDDALAEMLAQHNILTVLGIDGAPLYNDATRRTREGEPTSMMLERKVKLLHRYGVRLAASTTLTPANVYAASEHKAYLSSLGITHIGFNVLKGNALKMSLSFMSEAEYYHAVAEAVMLGYRDNDGVIEYQFQKKIDALAERKPFSVDCTCYGNQLVIQADGMVTNCPFLRIDLGHVRSLPSDFRIGKSEAVSSWRRRIPLLIEEKGSECRSFLHGGGCAWGSNELYGVLSKPDTGNELFNSEVMYAIVWKNLSERARDQLFRGECVHWSYRGIGSL